MRAVGTDGVEIDAGVVEGAVAAVVGVVGAGVARYQQALTVRRPTGGIGVLEHEAPIASVGADRVHVDALHLSGQLEGERAPVRRPRKVVRRPRPRDQASPGGGGIDQVDALALPLGRDQAVRFPRVVVGGAARDDEKGERRVRREENPDRRAHLGARASAASTEPAPSLRTRASRDVKSTTVEATPGSSPPSSSAAAASRSSRGTSSSRRGSWPPARFALVATTGPARRSTSAASGGRFGTRTPIASGRLPVSHAKRRAGFGRTSVYGPGRSARTTRSGSSGTDSSSASTSPARIAVGRAAARPF